MNPLIQKLRDLEKSASNDWKLTESEKDFYSVCIECPEYFDSNGNDTNSVTGRIEHYFNANLIVELRNSLPTLLDLIERQAKALEVADEFFDKIEKETEIDFQGNYVQLGGNKISKEARTEIREILETKKENENGKQ